MAISTARIKSLIDKHPQTSSPSSTNLANALSEDVARHSAAIVSTIQDQEDYDRIAQMAKNEGMDTVPDWIAYCSLSQALANRNAIKQFCDQTFN